MSDYLNLMMQQMGVSLWIIVIIFIWSFTWKMLALWKAARNNSSAWFIILALVNTIGILDILYLYVFSKSNKPQPRARTSRRKRRR